MISSEENIISLCDPDDVIPVPISDYAKKLDIKVRERYLQKISTIGIDPVLIEGKSFEPDCLPPVEYNTIQYNVLYFERVDIHD